MFIADSGASLHMMSKTGLTSGEKDTTRRSKEPTAITTAIGRAEKEDAAVHVGDLDVSVTMMLLDDSQQCYLWFYCAKKWASFMNGIGRVSIVCQGLGSFSVQV